MSDNIKVRRETPRIPILMAGSVEERPGSYTIEHLNACWYGTADARWFPQSTAAWPEVGASESPYYIVNNRAYPNALPTCGACGEVITSAESFDTCQICGKKYHKVGCGISTLYSFTCKACMASGRLPKGYRLPE